MIRTKKNLLLAVVSFTFSTTLYSNPQPRLNFKEVLRALDTLPAAALAISQHTERLLFSARSAEDFAAIDASLLEDDQRHLLNELTGPHTHNALDLALAIYFHFKRARQDRIQPTRVAVILAQTYHHLEQGVYFDKGKDILSRCLVNFTPYGLTTDQALEDKKALGLYMTDQILQDPEHAYALFRSMFKHLQYPLQDWQDADNKAEVIDAIHQAWDGFSHEAPPFARYRVLNAAHKAVHTGLTGLAANPQRFERLRKDFAAARAAGNICWRPLDAVLP